MPGTVKIWWHDGSAIDSRRNDLPVVNEPELGFETVAVSTTATATGAAPKEATLALIESDVNLRYRVCRPGDNMPADVKSCKPIAATGGGIDFIGVAAGCSISFVEA